MFSKDIRMHFGLDKCKILSIQQGKVSDKDGQIIESLGGHESYKCLGLAQSRRLQHKAIKDKVSVTYLQRIAAILKSNLMVETQLKLFAVPVLTNTFGTVVYHPRSAVERLILP
ncbi:hypothetical protein ILUMI_13539 [Ignelater luminosus]|uniref:Uncharacterized protein n=1 Tax=Ignelater luminosus TaxID=2038154 RepID=A0A8K0GBV4_IGNLU|nr:hypothetical protein ILUMI_13539 [Ignelater luminosus]